MLRYISILISSILMGISFSIKELSLLAWIGLVPYIYVLLSSDLSKKQGFKYGVVYGSGFYLFLLHWLFELYPLEWLGFNNKQSIIILILGWLVFSIVEGFILSVGGIIFSIFKTDNNTKNIISLGFIWVIIEWIQQMGIFGFTWGRISISQADNLYLVQSAALLGSLFISFIMVVINGFLATIMYEYILNKRIHKKYIFIVIIIFVSNVSYGIIRINNDKVYNEVNVSVIQGNIASDEKWNFKSVEKHLDIYMNITKDALDKAKLNNRESQILIWPETAIPINLKEINKTYNRYTNLAKNNNVIFITGGFSSELKDSKMLDYNSIYTFNNNGEEIGLYSKRHLVPFGEYLPFRNFILNIYPEIENINILEDDITPGKYTEITNTEFGNVGGVICFESIFPHLVRESVKDGAEILTILTNDSWFKDSKAVYQHNNQAVLRAIENNRYVIRAANTGISSIIDNKGRIISIIEPLKSGYINEKVEFIKEKTMYTIVGDLIVIIAVLWGLYMFIYKYKNS